MCGIAGVAHRDGSPIGDPRGLAATLGATLAHRGPDGSDAWTAPRAEALLVHRRLAIIDRGEGGRQPMVTPDGRHVIVFNGEVYNFRELRADLEARGECFRTSSDTEVLLRLLALDGPEALARVRGMFALACWDTLAQSLLVARDRFGIKPLYIAAAPGSIAFASELGALRAARLVDAAASPSAVLAFLAWGSVPPPLAWNAGAEMLEPGAWFEWRQDGVERRGLFADARAPYRFTDVAPVNPRAWADQTAAAVTDSVRAHLVADVPVGVFLSGGIDSGVIASTAVSDAPAIQTFTVSFDHASSEAPQARAVARALGTTHHEIVIDASHVAEDFPAMLARLDQPTIDAVNGFYVSRAVASTGIKAVLSGAGGDELFGGYPSFVRLPRAIRAKRIAGPLWPAVAAAGRVVVPERLQTRWRHFAGSNGNLIEAYRVQRAFLLPEELSAIAGPALLDRRIRVDASIELDRMEHTRLDPAGREQPAASVARMESRMYLTSQLLRDLDVMSMAHGLEVRVPYVDHVLLDAVWPELGRQAPLLARKRLLRGMLAKAPYPADVARLPKQGFTLPFATWMRGDLGLVVRDGLHALGAAGWIADGAPDRIWRAWLEGQSHWSRPWGLGLLGHFLHS